MLIIDRNKDFYDHFSHIYGIDNKVVFDRRGSHRLTDSKLLEFAKAPSKRYDLCKERYFLLEVGREQFLIEVSDIQYTGTYKEGLEYSSNGYLQSCSMKVVTHWQEDENLFGKPLTISPVEPSWRYSFKAEKYLAKLPKSFADLKDILPNQYSKGFLAPLLSTTPILAGTSLTKILDPFELWKTIQMYISSLNTEKCVDIAMTDVAKAETHGFDKQSFRHPIK